MDAHSKRHKKQPDIPTQLEQITLHALVVISGRRALGSVEVGWPLKQGAKVMSTLWQDIRYGYRTLLSNRGFTLVAIITLAIGIGATTTVFTVVNAVVLRPLPYRDSDRLVKLNVTNTRTGERTSPLNFLDWRTQNETFESLGGYFAPTPLDPSRNCDP